MDNYYTWKKGKKGSSYIHHGLETFSYGSYKEVSGEETDEE